MNSVALRMNGASNGSECVACSSDAGPPSVAASSERVTLAKAVKKVSRSL